MPKSLAKVQKKLSKKRGNVSSLHENSRDAQRLRRAGARGEKLARVAAARAKGNQPHSMLRSQELVVCQQLNVHSAKGSLLSGGSKSSNRAN